MLSIQSSVALGCSLLNLGTTNSHCVKLIAFVASSSYREISLKLLVLVTLVASSSYHKISPKLPVRVTLVASSSYHKISPELLGSSQYIITL